MALKKVISADDAVALIRDGDVVASSGYGGNGNPERSSLQSSVDFWLETDLATLRLSGPGAKATARSEASID